MSSVVGAVWLLGSSMTGRGCHRVSVSLLRKTEGESFALHASSIISATRRESTVSSAEAWEIGGVCSGLFNTGQ